MIVVLLTSTSLRHKYIASKLNEVLDLQLVITEKKSSKIEDTTTLSKEEANFVTTHFNKRAASEASFFGEYKNFPEKTPHLSVAHKEINNQFVFEVLNIIKPDLIILFGTSIIKNHIIEKYPDKIINLHLGLSPYFKGSATNLFPVLYNKLECIGATIHKVTEKVDAGDILHQLRPDIELNDNIHAVGNKVILKSGIILPKVLRSYLEGKIAVVSQKIEKGIICKIKDLTPIILRKIYTNMSTNLVEDFIQNKKLLETETPIIQNYKA
jgi:folate-dependent phosphoribosylglycinamide formyltransferase PurN